MDFIGHSVDHPPPQPTASARGMQLVDKCDSWKLEVKAAIVLHVRHKPHQSVGSLFKRNFVHKVRGVDHFGQLGSLVPPVTRNGVEGPDPRH